MKKIVSTAMLSLLLFSGVVFAQEDTLPPAGITPESPFFFLDRFSEGVGTFFTFGSAAKAKRYLVLAEERLAEAQALAERGDDNTEVAIKLFEEQFKSAQEKAQESGKFDVTAKVTEAAIKHISVLDEVIDRVPRQAKDALRATKERSLDGQIEALRALAKQDPQRMIGVFVKATERRLRAVQAKAERGSEDEEKADEAAVALEEYDKYTQFGQEISSIARSTRTVDTTVQDLVKKATSHHIQVLEDVRRKLPPQAQDKLQRALDNARRVQGLGLAIPSPTQQQPQLPTPQPKVQQKTQPQVPAKKVAPQSRPTTPIPTPIEQKGIKPSLAEQFSQLESELTGARASGSRLAPEHYDRIKGDLTKLESQGYPPNEIERLNKIAIDLSPHLQGPIKQGLTSSSTPSAEQTNTAVTPKPNCISNPSPVFTSHITDISKVSYVVPPPTMGSGPSLKTHSYIGTNGVNVAVYAPTAMTLKAGSHYVGGPYSFEFRASCEVSVRYGHITNPLDALKKLLPSEPQPDSRTQELSPVSFAAGDLIGYTTGTVAAGNWDFGVYNSTKVNRFANDPNWNKSDTYTTAVCPFDYFAPDLKAGYIARFDSKILGGNSPHGESFCL